MTPPSCHAVRITTAPPPRAALTDTDGPLQVFLVFLLLVIPVLIGMFWGAPLLAREYESGTYRLAWTQGVTRTRWLAVKLGLGALVSIVVSGLLSLIVTWWWSPLNAVSANPFDPLYFGTRDLTPVGYAAFAFVLGTCAGLLMRRTVPAMFTALAGFAAVRYVMNSWVRPHLITPLRKVIAINPSSALNMGETPAGFQVSATTREVLPGDWVYSNRDRGQGRPCAHDGVSQPCLPSRPCKRPGELRGLCHQPRRPVPRAGHLSTREPLLDIPVVRDGHLSRPDRSLGWDLLLVDSTPLLSQRTTRPAVLRYRVRLRQSQLAS